MPRLSGKLAILFAELRRRKVVQVTIAYAALAWLVLQVGDIALEAFEAPPWAMRLIFVLLMIGLPIVFALSWIFDLSPDGILRTAPREIRRGHQDFLSAVMLIVPPDSAPFDSSTLRKLTAH